MQRKGAHVNWLISVFKAPVRRGVLGPFVVALTLSANQGPSAQEALSPGVMFARSPLPTPGATASGEPEREAIRAVESAFNDTVLPQTGLVDPTVIAFAPDGRMFVAEKSGRILGYDNVATRQPWSSPTCASTSTTSGTAECSAWHSHPNFPDTPYIYVLYTYDAVPGGTAPRWGSASNPRGSLSDAARADDRWLRGHRTADPARRRQPRRRIRWITTDEVPLITDWFQQFRATRSGRWPSASMARSMPAAATAPASTTPTTARSPRTPAQSIPCSKAGRCAPRTSGPAATRSDSAARSFASMPIPVWRCPTTRAMA